MKNFDLLIIKIEALAAAALLGGRDWAGEVCLAILCIDLIVWLVSD